MVCLRLGKVGNHGSNGRDFVTIVGAVGWLQTEAGSVRVLVVPREEVKVHVAHEALIFDLVPTLKDLNVRMPDNGLVGRHLDEAQTKDLFIDLEHF